MTASQPIPETAPQIALPWIVRLRYGMALGQIATALFVRYALGVDIPLAAFAIAPILVAASNGVRVAHAERHSLSFNRLRRSQVRIVLSGTLCRSDNSS